MSGITNAPIECTGISNYDDCMQYSKEINAQEFSDKPSPCAPEKTSCKCSAEEASFKTAVKIAEFPRMRVHLLGLRAEAMKISGTWRYSVKDFFDSI